MYCKKCGKELANTAKFCRYCGAAISGQTPIQKEEKTQKKKIKKTKDKKQPKVNAGEGKTSGKKWLIAAIIAISILLLAVAVYFAASYFIKKSSEETALEWQEQYDLGVKYLESGDCEKAILAFETALKIDPKSEGTYVALAEAQTAAGDEEAATQTIQLAVENTGNKELNNWTPRPTAAPTAKPQPAPQTTETPVSTEPPAPVDDGIGPAETDEPDMPEEQDDLRLAEVRYYQKSDDGDTQLSETVQYLYNEKAWLVQKNSISESAAVTYDLSYDDAGRMTRKAADGESEPQNETVEREYDETGNLIYEGSYKIGDDWYDVSYAYDDERVAEESWNCEALAQEYEYTHEYDEDDEDGYLIDTRHKEGTTAAADTVFKYDEDGRLVQGYDEDSQIPVKYTYEADLPCLSVQTESVNIEDDSRTDEEKTDSVTRAVISDEAGATVESILLGTNPELEYNEDGYLIKAEDEYGYVELIYTDAADVIKKETEENAAEEDLIEEDSTEALEEAPDGVEVPAEAYEEGDVPDWLQNESSFSDEYGIAGQLWIMPSGDGYDIEISIYGLTTIDDATGYWNRETLSFTGTDADGNPIGGEISKTSGGVCVKFTDSTWTYIENGDEYYYFEY